MDMVGIEAVVRDDASISSTVKDIERRLKGGSGTKPGVTDLKRTFEELVELLSEGPSRTGLTRLNRWSAVVRASWATTPPTMACMRARTRGKSAARRITQPESTIRSGEASSTMLAQSAPM